MIKNDLGTASTKQKTAQHAIQMVYGRYFDHVVYLKVLSFKVKYSHLDIINFLMYQYLIDVYWGYLLVYFQNPLVDSDCVLVKCSFKII